MSIDGIDQFLMIWVWPEDVSITVSNPFLSSQCRSWFPFSWCFGYLLWDIETRSSSLLWREACLFGDILQHTAMFCCFRCDKVLQGGFLGNYNVFFIRFLNLIFTSLINYLLEYLFSSLLSSRVQYFCDKLRVNFIGHDLQNSRALARPDIHPCFVVFLL